MLGYGVGSMLSFEERRGRERRTPSLTKRVYNFTK
jgi:hypothetical protein